ncbi:MAG: hypothetical protein UZ17_ACD001000509 [Acidobacteria bacterium OLB17]|nr:MAG: hypothetical protein UZ17_ACD001000509 [Acidobacteria bacterium OLB17]
MEPSFSISLETVESSPAPTEGGFEPGGGGGPSVRTRPRSEAAIGPPAPVFASETSVRGTVEIPVISGVPDVAGLEFPFDTTPGPAFEFPGAFAAGFEFGLGPEADPQAENRKQKTIMLRYFI